jgi:ribose transport system ATP-binding protein
VVYVSHRLDEIKELADRVTVLRDGISGGSHDVSQLERADLVSLIVGPSVVGPAAQPGREPLVPGVAKGAARLQVTDLHAGQLDAVSLTVGAGEIVGIAGLVGSGRDEFAAAVTGNLRDSRAALVCVGERTFTGQLDPADLRGAGLVLAVGNRGRGAAVSRFSLRENITLPVLPRYRRGGRIVRRLERNAVEQWITDLDIKPRTPERLFALFSGGNQQKAVIAAALNQHPHVVILDEPTAGVDVAAREAIYVLLRAYAARGVGFVVVSSDLEDFTALTDRVVVLSQGHVVDVFSTADTSKDQLLASILGFGQDHPAPAVTSE